MGVIKIIDTILAILVGLVGIYTLVKGTGKDWRWVAVAAINFSLLTILGYILKGGLDSVTLFKLPILGILKQCGTSFFIALALIIKLKK